MILDYVEFKKKLGLYSRYVRQYEKYNEFVEQIEYDLSKIPSMFPETTIVNGKIIPLPKAHGDPKQKELFRLEMIETKDKYEKLRDFYKSKYQEIDEVLNVLPNELHNTVVRIYINREGVEKVAREFNYSKGGFSYHIDKELQMFFESYNFERFEQKS